MYVSFSLLLCRKLHQLSTLIVSNLLLDEEQQCNCNQLSSLRRSGPFNHFPSLVLHFIFSPFSSSFSSSAEDVFCCESLHAAIIIIPLVRNCQSPRRPMKWVVFLADRVLFPLRWRLLFHRLQSFFFSSAQRKLDICCCCWSSGCNWPCHDPLSRSPLNLVVVSRFNKVRYQCALALHINRASAFARVSCCHEHFRRSLRGL